MTIVGHKWDEYLVKTKDPKKSLYSEFMEEGKDKTDAYIKRSNPSTFTTDEERELRKSLDQEELEAIRKQLRRRPEIVKALADELLSTNKDEDKEQPEDKEHFWSDGTKVY